MFWLASAMKTRYAVTIALDTRPNSYRMMNRRMPAHHTFMEMSMHFGEHMATLSELQNLEHLSMKLRSQVDPSTQH